MVQKTLAALADTELASLQAVLGLRAESNLMLGILVEAADLPSADLLPPVKDRFTATAGRLGKAAATLKDPDTLKLVDELARIGRGAGNVFDLKQKELAANLERIGNVTLSVGVAAAQDTDTLESLVERADAALYVAKRSGRNRVSVAAPSLPDGAPPDLS